MIRNLSDKVMNDVTEIRLRVGRPLNLTVAGENVFLNNSGQVCYLRQQGLLVVTKEEIEATFDKMCEHSVYMFTEQLKNGYIALKHGCRAGIAAGAVYENGEITTFSHITSINIRIAAEYIGCADFLSDYLSEGLLIAGPPSSGKTTVLRDAIRKISDGIGTQSRRVSVIDTRGEIAAVNNSVPSNYLGSLCDVISTCDKIRGIDIALRTLNPQVIAFDEISDENEARAVINGFHSGVFALMTIHAGSVYDLLKRKASFVLINSGVVKNVALLKGVGMGAEIISVDSLKSARAKNVLRRCDFA